MKRIKQHDNADCGAACLATVLALMGNKQSLARCRNAVGVTQYGCTLEDLCSGGKKFGLEGEGYNGTYQELLAGISTKEIKFPFIAHVLIDNIHLHYIVIEKIINGKIIIFDPGYGRKKISVGQFQDIWTGNIVAFEKTLKFKKRNDLKKQYQKFYKIFGEQKQYFFTIVLLSVLISLASILSTFAYEYLIDGIMGSTETSEIEHEESHVKVPETVLSKILYYICNCFEFWGNNIIILMLVTLSIYIFTAFFQWIRSLLVANMAKQVNITLFNLYWNKLNKLPVEFYETNKIGEIIARYNDIKEIKVSIANGFLAVILDGLS